MASVRTIGRRVLGLLGLAALPVGVFLLRPVHADLPAVSEPEYPVVAVESAPLDSLAAYVVAHDLFRQNRAPAPRAFSVVQQTDEPATAPKELPVLLVTGIVWGHRPSAVIEGVPGSAGAVLAHSGDTLGGIRIARITPSSVTLQGPDTTWSLPVRTPWP